MVLGSGPLPLDILARNVDEWIASRSAGSGANAASRGAANSAKRSAAKRSSAKTGAAKK